MVHNIGTPTAWCYGSNNEQDQLKTSNVYNIVSTKLRKIQVTKGGARERQRSEKKVKQIGNNNGGKINNQYGTSEEHISNTNSNTNRESI